MTDVRIEKATDDEREWAAAMLSSCEPWITLRVDLEQCRQACRDPEYLMYVAHLEGAPCGVVLLQRRGVAGSPYVKSIAVAEGFRKRGVGATLMDFAENLYRGEAKHIFLCVSSFNVRARAFYERRGYKAAAEFEDYVIEGASEILMHKRLR